MGSVLPPSHDLIHKPMGYPIKPPSLCPHNPFLTMARTYKRRRTSKPFVARKRKRTYTKRRSLRTRVPRTRIGAFPNTKTLSLRYVENFSLNTGAATVATAVYSMNGLFDPSIAIGGHQPMFFDTYMKIYQRYRVNRAYITFIALDTHVTPTSYQVAGNTTGLYYGANERACRMFILKDPSSTDFNTSLNTMIEEGNTNLAWKFAPQTTSGKVHKLSMWGDARTLLNCNKKDEELLGSITSNPSNEAYFICGVDNMSPDANADSMNFQVIITYNVTFSNLIKNQVQN